MRNNSIKYTNVPADIEQALDDAIIASDLLPSPDELVRKVEKKTS